MYKNEGIRLAIYAHKLLGTLYASIAEHSQCIVKLQLTQWTYETGLITKRYCKCLHTYLKLTGTAYCMEISQ